MKKLFVLLSLMASCVLGAQTTLPVENLAVRWKLRTQAGSPTSASSVNSNTATNSPDKCFLIFNFFADSIPANGLIQIQVGSQQDSSEILNETFTLVQHQTSQSTFKCIHSFTNTTIEYGPLRFGFANITLALPVVDLTNAKWATVFVINNQSPSIKKYYSLQ